MFCTHPHYFKGTLFNAHSNIPKWIIYNLRKIFLTAASKKIINYKKIYIDRSDSQYNHCKIINDTEIKKYLKKKGFKIIRLSEYSLKEQISIFKNCKLIVGPHGAGLVNLIFCKKKTKVLEIKNIGHPNISYQKISKYNNLKHQYIMLKKIENNKQGDMFLPIKKLENFLN